MEQNDQLHCWLCGSLSQLTSEHIPPSSAFNSRSMVVQQLSEKALAKGYIAWENGAEHRRGHALNSLCTKCNHRGGRTFVPSYLDLVQRVAKQVSSRIPLQRIRIEAVRNPQLILRQVLLQFVSANGESFVKANSWIKPILLSRQTHVLPEDVHIYLFATQSRRLRTSGISGHVLIEEDRYRIVSEFTYWPLGTVLSFCDLGDEQLFRITEWSKIPFNFKGTVDLDLPVNPVESALPVDFRDALDIWLDMVKPAKVAAKEELVYQMAQALKLRGGHTEQETILTASPAQVELHARDQARATHYDASEHTNCEDRNEEF